MVKTLRITGFLTVLSAIAIIALIINSGVKIDPNIQDFLDGPQVVDVFTASMGSRPATPTNQVHPLVQQAKAFAKILAPEPVIKKPRSGNRNNTIARPTPPRTVTPKFEVVSTIYYAENPGSSLALIREGKQTRWITQGDTINHLLISEIKDGVVVIKNGEELSELTTPEKTFASPVISTSDRTRITNPVPAATTNRTRPKISEPVRTPRTSPVVAPRSTVAPKTTVAPRTMDETEKMERLEDLLTKFQMIQNSTETNPDGSELTTQDKAVQMQKLITEFKKANTNVDGEESQRLIDLGTYLEHMQGEN